MIPESWVTGERLPGKKVLLISLFGLMLWRILFLAISGLELDPDEAYYWDWSRRLDWCYYSKPPMIAWIIGASTRLLGVSTFTVRLPSVLIGTGGIVLFYQLAKRMFNPRVGLLAALLFVLSPANCALNLAMTTDSPQLFFWTATMLLVWTALTSQRSLQWWLFAGIANGLGILSKQHALALLPMVGAYLLFEKEHRRHLLRGFILHAVTALFFLIPILWWNAQHGWITFQHTSEHFDAEKIPVGQHLAESGEFLVSQLLIMTPVTLAAMWLAIAAALRRYVTVSPPVRFLMLTGPLALIPVYLLSLKQALNPNWPAPLYLSALILAAAWLLEKAPRRRWIRAALVTGLVMLLLTYIIPVSIKPLGLEGSKIDPAHRLRGWRELAAAVHEVRKEHNTLADEEFFIFSTGARRPVSLMALYLPDRPLIQRWKRSKSVKSQYDLWAGPVDQLGKNGLVLTEETQGPEHFPEELARVFEKVEYLDTVRVPYRKTRVHVYHLYRASDLKAWPPGVVRRPAP